MFISIFSYFFSPERPVALVVNLVISAVAFITGVRLVLTWRASDTEIAGLDSVRNQASLSQSKAGLDSHAAPKPVANSAISDDQDAIARERLANAANKLDSDSPMVAARLRNLAALHRRGDDIDHEALAAVAVSQLDRSTMSAKWATNAVVLLGLLGTLIGLSTAVQSAGGLLQAGSAATISQAIAAVTATFEGVKVAFSATLLGAVSAVVLGFELTWVRSRQALFLQQLEELTAVELVPLYRTTPGLALATAARRLTEMEADLTTGLQLVIDSLVEQGRAIEQQLESFSDRMIRKTEELVDRFDASSQSLARLIGAGSNASLTDALTALHASATEIQTVVSAAAMMIPQLEEGIARQIDQQTADINAALNSYSGHIAKGVEQQTSAISLGMQRFDELIPTMAETIARGVDQQTADINTALNAYAGQQRQQTSENATQLSKIESILTDLDQTITRFEAAITNGTATLSTEHTAVLEAVAELKQLRTDLSTSLIQMPETVAKLLTARPTGPATPAFRGPAPLPRPAATLTTPPRTDQNGSTSDVAATTISAAPPLHIPKGSEASAAPRNDSQNLFRRWFGGRD